MARLATIDPTTASGKPKELLDAVKKKMGLVPNLTKVLANSPAALEAYLGMSGALGHGELPAKVREQIAILVAETNACSYCLSAHTALGKMAGLTPGELEASRQGRSEEAKAAAALRFAQSVMTHGGGVSEQDVHLVRTAGYSDGQIAEIIAHVGLNIFTNYFNKAAAVEVDFPVIKPARAV